MDSDEEAAKKPNPLHSEFLGGAGDSDCSEVEDTEGDLTVKRQALRSLDLAACKAMLKRQREVERASAPGRHREADMQMKGYVSVFGSILESSLPGAPRVVFYWSSYWLGNIYVLSQVYRDSLVKTVMS